MKKGYLAQTDLAHIPDSFNFQNANGSKAGAPITFSATENQFKGFHMYFYQITFYEICVELLDLKNFTFGKIVIIHWFACS